MPNITGQPGFGSIRRGNEMINLEQEKRLKEAGFLLKMSKKGDCSKCGYFCKSKPNDKCPEDNDHCLHNPTEKELIEFLKTYIFQIEPFEHDWRIVGFDGWEVIHSDITEALVQAVEQVLKGGGEGK